MTVIPISQSVANLRYSVIREMLGMASGLPDVINLSIGEPDFATPPQIVEQALADARNGHTHYTASQGDPELREKLARKIAKSYPGAIDQSSILITHGGMGALTAAMRTLLDPGEEVLLVEPYFPDYLAHVSLAGGKVAAVPTRMENGFVVRPEDIAKAVTPLSRVLVLNAPNNPTGAVLPGEVLDEIAGIAISNNLVVVSDEVYEEILFSGEPDSICTRPGMADRTLVIKSFSKSHAMTGWRVGYCFGPQGIIAQMLKVVNYSTSCASSVSQRAALHALDLDKKTVAGFRDVFRQRMERVCTMLDTMDGVRYVRPKGSIYVFADISAVVADSRDFAVQLLKEKGVVVVPGYAFGASAEGCIRIACTQELSVLEEGMERMADFVAKRQQR